MRRILKATAIALLAASIPLSLVPASAAPLMPTSTSKVTSSPIETVQYRGHYRGGPRYYGGHRHGGGGAGVAGAVIGGLVVGGIIAGAAAAQANQQAQQHHAYCAQRYRSYDPGSGTFLANDGYRYPCQ